MNALDLVLVAGALLAAAGGWRLGFVARISSWLGLTLGVAVGTVLVPPVVDHVGTTWNAAGRLLIGLAVVTALGAIGEALGLWLGTRVAVAVPAGTARQIDKVVGAGAGIVAVGAIAWLLTPAMADISGWPARQARGSAVVAALESVLPAGPEASTSLRRLLGDDYPQAFAGLGRAPDLGEPPAASGLSPATSAQAARSTVEVIGQACGGIQQGSGFVVAPGLIATNAHVVAGESGALVETTDGRQHPGTIVAFDPGRDVAILAVDGLDRPALALADAHEGDMGAVFGHPGGQPLRQAPFAIGEVVTAAGTDIYDDRTSERDVLVLAASLAPGDSGSALVDPRGAVIGMAFAIAPDRPTVAYALATREIVAVLESAGAAAVPTGPCIR